MKLFKRVNISSDGSFYFHYSLLKSKTNNIFKKNDDKNFKLNQKKINKKTNFQQFVNYKRKYM